MFITAGLIIYLAHKSFSLIWFIPDNVLNWIGGGRGLAEHEAHQEYIGGVIGRFSGAGGGGAKTLGEKGVNAAQNAGQKIRGMSQRSQPVSVEDALAQNESAGSAGAAAGGGGAASGAAAGGAAAGGAAAGAAGAVAGAVKQVSNEAQETAANPSEGKGQDGKSGKGEEYSA